MKYLHKETCEYLVSLGCTSESGMFWYGYHDREFYVKPLGDIGEWRVPAFSLEDILRKDNAEKIWPGQVGKLTDRAHDGYPPIFLGFTQEVVRIFQSYPEDWPEGVAKLIKP